MTRILLIVLFLNAGQALAQSPAEVLQERMKAFHLLMTRPDTSALKFIDDSLSYGHSNGWVETAAEFRQNLGTKLVYHSIREDSVLVVVRGKVGYTRFNGDFDVSLNGNRAVYQLKVLEVWVLKKNNWVLLARQAVRR